MSHNFYHNLPKIELHAHLNGSLSRETIHKLAEIKEKNSGEKYEIPEGYKIDGYKLEELSECFKLFQVAYDLVDSKEALILATKAVIKEFSEDNVIYLELRSTPRATKDMTKMEYMTTVVETMIECQNLYPIIIVKYLPSINRSHPIPVLEENMNLFLELKDKYPNIVLGVDMSGDPDPTKNKFSSLKHLFEKARNSGLKLALHCGEIEKEEENYEMLEFGMDRIGHGTFYSENYKETWKLLLEKKIPIEICLTSNVLCGSVKSYEDHHFSKFFTMGYPVCICTDDFGVFDTSLSKEFKICAETFKLSQKDLVQLSLNAIDYTFANEAEKNVLREKIQKFCQENNL